MVSRCMKTDTPFGVLLIREGEEAGTASTYDVGTLARISDFYQGSDGLLGVTALGEQRFRLLSSERQDDGLNVGEVELIDNEAPLPLPGEFQSLPQILANVMEDLGRLYDEQGRKFDDAVWVTYRLLEILPIDLAQKQLSLESSDTIKRLQLVGELLDSVRRPSSH